MLQSEAGRLPRPHNEEDALKLVDLAEKVNEAATDKADMDADIVKTFAYTAAGELSPMAATLGGIVGQEVRPPAQKPPGLQPEQSPFLSQSPLSLAAQKTSTYLHIHMQQASLCSFTGRPKAIRLLTYTACRSVTIP